MNPEEHYNEPSELEEAVLILLEEAGIDQGTCDAIMKLIEQAETRLSPADDATDNGDRKQRFCPYEFYDGSPKP